MGSFCVLLFLISAPSAFGSAYERAGYQNFLNNLQRTYNSSGVEITRIEDAENVVYPISSKLVPISMQGPPILPGHLSCGKLQPIMNAKISCRSSWQDKQCEVTCLNGYYMNTTLGTETCLTFVCRNGIWMEKKNAISLPDRCQPKCDPACANGGICVLPNTCQCPKNYYGPSCDIENIPCTSLPSMPNFSQRRCNEKKCVVTCTSGRTFPDGSLSVEMFCDNGKWKLSKSGWDTIPDCEAICSPPCLNGGKCIGTDTCMCSEEFRGPYCQYSVSQCDPSKLNFNGAYNCKGDDEVSSCHLTCPPNMSPSKPFETVYTCMYSEGVFQPNDIPLCEFSSGIETGVIIKEIITSITRHASCMLWNSQVKMLNDKILSFRSNCAFTVLEDDVDHLFHIQAAFSNGVIKNVIIFINSMEYILSRSDDGKPLLVVSSTGQKLSIPSQLTDLKVEIVSGNTVAIYLPAIDTSLVWNLEDELQIDTSEKFSNQNAGLCGRKNSILTADWQAHVAGSVVNNLADKCETPIEPVDPPSEEDITIAKFISQLFITETMFAPCLKKLSAAEFATALEWSYHNCAKPSKQECVCQFYSKFVQHCNHVLGTFTVDWREKLNCTMKCPTSKVYTSCVPVSQATCTSLEVAPSALQKYCEEGCVCAPGTVLHEGQCISKEVCPCIYGGKFYEPDSIIPKDCNKCTCSGGKWLCTEEICKAECLIFGDPHYRTFDGKKFDFSGFCMYKLVVTDNVTIETENSFCNKCLSKSKIPSTTKTVIIRTGKNVIQLKENFRVLVNKEEIEDLPFHVDTNTYIRKASSLILQVVLPNGLEVLWTGKTKLQIFANASLFGKTKGLCGTFNRNQQDDLLTPENDVEKSIKAFANKWRSNEKCKAEKDVYDGSNACEIFVQNKAMAEVYCKNLTSSIFQDCHSVIDPNTYVEDCMNDMCSCHENNPSECFCPILSSYAQECARVGIILDWRSKVRSCGIHCPYGQKFEPCGMSCQRSCADISHGEMCRGSCTEGCYCPTGHALNENEECIPIASCPCWYQGRKHPTGFVDVRDKTEAWECRNAVWERKIVTKEELEKLLSRFTCESPNMEYVECEPPEPITCRNMHNPPKFSSKTCHGGCVCQKGFVMEPNTKQCVKPVDCPCHHGGRSYTDQETIKEDCNTCTCTKGKWKCTDFDCQSVCSTWGDSHFRTFDGRYFDFQGTCDYTFAKGQLSDIGFFSVAIEVVPCGTGGTSCTQSVTVTAGNTIETETLFLEAERGSNLSKEYKKFDIISTGLNVIIVLKGYSVTLFWDKSTRVTLQVDPMWKSKMTGLCGNNNGNAEDDFQSPSGGLVEVLPEMFADSWKLQQHCPFPGKIQNTCIQHPERKFWSVLKCSLLKDSPIFQKCHAEVPVEDFYKRCVFDACACDQGGDCECLCTTFAAYAQECSTKGVTLKWRRQDLCPIQCDGGTKYSPCISSCPEKTCENLYSSDSSCQQISCVEGCEKLSCPDHKVRLNSTSSECVPAKECPCMVINGTIYKEQQQIISDDCHSCICTGGMKKCVGLPCIQTEFTITTPLKKILSPIPCITGWSNWTSIDRNEMTRISKDNIIYDSPSDQVNCKPEEMVGLRCQAVTNGSSEPRPIECNFDSKVEYPEGCVDFQIQIRCECKVVMSSVTIITMNQKLSTKALPLVPPTTEPQCHQRCGDLCHYLRQQMEEQGICRSVEDCVDAYVNTTCSEGRKLRDEVVCVKPEDCTCMSKNNTLVRPSVYIKEPSDCSICQCFKNQYVCSVGKCQDAPTRSPQPATPPPTEEPEPTPPPSDPLPYCSPNKLVPIDQNATYNASSSFIGSEPKFAKLQTAGGRPKNIQAWKPENSDAGHYLEVDLSSRLPVYAIEIAGCPEKYEYVKSFKLQYSTDGATFYSAYATSGSKIFGGCFDPKIPQKQMLKDAVEARYLRIRPITWQNGVTMLINVLGCKSKIPEKILCKNLMGIESGQLLPHQVTVSSKLNDDFHPHDLSVNSLTGWTPLVASTNEYVQFNFYDERTIEGIVTKGGNNPLLSQESWIEAYKVRYSVDGKQWMKIFDNNDKEKIFPANFDNFSPYMNTFNVPVKANLLRLYPVKWNNYPTLRIELMGCYKPYENVPPPPPPSPPNVCDGVKLGSETCHNQLYWNGTTCVDKEFCPCVVGLFVHEVGAVFFQNACARCTCSLGGSESCEEISDECSSCNDQKMMYTISDTCSCECAPCPSGTKLCPRSNICLNASRWCDGKQDCADDEPENCTEEERNENIPIPPPPSTTAQSSPNFCPTQSCAQQYSVNVKSEIHKSARDGRLRWTKVTTTTKKIIVNRLTGFMMVTNSSATRQLSSSANEYKGLLEKQSSEFTGVHCNAWECQPNGDTCPEKPRCPFGTKIQLKSTEGTCPKYECIPLSPGEKECRVNGPQISTFDGLQYTYEICDHVLAQDQFHNWRVRKLNKYTDGNCETSLIITHFNDQIQFFTNFTTLFNGFSYTVPQLQAIGARTELFTIEPVATKFVIFSSLELKFSVIWGSLGTSKIIVDAGLHHMIDGLCGHFDFDMKNDKMKPDGSITYFAEEFGNSWKYGNETCNMNVCPEDVQKKAREICSSIKKSPFDVCDFTLNVEEEISKCVASICTCAAHSDNFEKECGCSALENFAIKCLSQQPGADLSLWRVKHGCAMNCTAPFVYQECFDRHCEPGCSSLLQRDACPRLENRCFGGCYCPSGLLREGDTCIKSIECRDAVCTMNSLRELVTFDETQIPFDEISCGSYILMETKRTETLDSELKIVVSQMQCKFGKKSFKCPALLTIQVDKQTINLYQVKRDLIVKVDNEVITSFPYNDKTIKLTKNLGISVTLSVPSLMLDVIYKENFKGFSIRLPSYKYSDSLRGLCGTVNNSLSDDVINLDDSSSSKYVSLLTNWETKGPAEADQYCVPGEVYKMRTCNTSLNDVCSLLTDEKVFGKCNLIVDPAPYLESCRKTVCNDGSHCYSFAAYAEECYKNGLCIAWRNVNRCPPTCPFGTKYQACGSGCEITCDNYETIENDLLCSKPFMERCSCPQGQALLNGTCVEETKCKPCDKLGHYPGSKWKPDNCTECECSKDRNINCQKKECQSDIICPVGTRKVIDTNNDDSCCEKYICETIPAEGCPPLIQIDCAKFQEKQLTTMANNCTQYICSCIPKETCPKLEEEDIELLPGMVRKLKTDSCCPQYEIECNVNTCPLHPDCKPYEKLIEVEKKGQCCPTFKCEPPPNTCVYHYQWIVDSNGTERFRQSTETFTELKKVGDAWLDGLCHECVCRNETLNGICTRIKCDTPAVNDKYVMEAIYHPEQCCPKYKAVACKVNEVELAVNQSVPVENEPCKIIRCIKNEITNEISREDVVERCKKDCKPGWEYRESDNSSVCCGSCIQTACTDSMGMIHMTGSEWYSSDGCTRYECDAEFKIIGYSETCPNVESCEEDKLYFDGCCQRCNFTIAPSLRKCALYPMKLNNTIGLISKQLPGNKKCSNAKPITGLDVCRGDCSGDHKAHYDSDAFKVATPCGCCTGLKFRSKIIRLNCEDGSTITQNIEIPIECSCHACGASQRQSNSLFSLFT